MSQEYMQDNILTRKRRLSDLFLRKEGDVLGKNRNEGLGNIATIVMGFLYLNFNIELTIMVASHYGSSDRRVKMPLFPYIC